MKCVYRQVGPAKVIVSEDQCGMYLENECVLTAMSHDGEWWITCNRVPVKIMYEAVQIMEMLKNGTFWTEVTE